MKRSLSAAVLTLLVLAPAVPAGAQAAPGPRGASEVPAREAAGTRSPAAAGPSLVVLVRHAERDGPSADDPPLSDLGETRARALGRLLADAGVTRIHVSATRRARDTGTPLAERLGIEPEVYDPRRLAAFAAALLEEPGRHLVVGHSNTTDELSGLLGGDSFGSIADAWEYDRLYLLTPSGAGGMTTVLLRYGPLSTAP